MRVGLSARRSSMRFAIITNKNIVFPIWRTSSASPSILLRLSWGALASLTRNRNVCAASQPRLRSQSHLAIGQVSKLNGIPLPLELAEAIETGGPSETKAILSAKTEAILDEMKRAVDSFREEVLMAHSVATGMGKMLIKRRDLDVIDPLRGRVLDLVDRLSQQPQKEEQQP